MSPTTDELLQSVLKAERDGDNRALLLAYDRYLTAEPKTGWAWAGAGVAAHRIGEWRVAENCYRRALAEGFGEPHVVHSNLSSLLLTEGRLDAAIDHGREAARLQPDFANGWLNVGLALRRGGRTGEALEVYEQAALAGARIPPALFLQAKRQLCLWDGLEKLNETVKRDMEAMPEHGPILCFFGYLATTDSEQRRYAEAFTRAEYGAGAPRWTKPRPPGRKLRLGYLSNDFYNHATTHLLVETIERHDRNRFDVIGFDFSPPNDQPAGLRIRRAFDTCHSLLNLSDAAAAEMIRQCGIDILIDLKGYTAECRTEILSLRPAPVQVNYLGWPGTMGAPFIDYMVADHIVAPDAAGFSERVLYLDCYQPTDTKREVGALPTRASQGLPENALVLGSMNTAWKLTPAILDIWADFLRATPDAVLWQLASTQCEAGLRQEARRRGIEHQLIFAPAMRQAEHIGRLGHIDLAVDTYPYGGHTTTSDLLWSGAPVLTIRGTSFCARVAASLVTAAGLPELVAADADDYRSKGHALIGDRERLKTLKSSLLQGRNTSLLFDNARYTAQLEQALLSTLEHDRL
jgi:protein O-GlcNAc transferase